jgi:methylenetetrahydrofolate reductase (NADPH)
MAICEYSQTYFGVDVLMHLTCTNLTCDELRVILKAARDIGIQNILALRGDPPKGGKTVQNRQIISFRYFFLC